MGFKPERNSAMLASPTSENVPRSIDFLLPVSDAERLLLSRSMARIARAAKETSLRGSIRSCQRCRSGFMRRLELPPMPSHDYASYRSAGKLQ